MSTPGPWRIYADKLAAGIQAMSMDQARKLTINDANGVGQTFSSLESIMKAYRMAEEMAQKEDAAAARATGAWGSIKLTRNGN